MDTLIGTLLVGALATAVMDLWGIARRRLFGIPAMNYALVGRWFAYLPRGRFRHDPIAATPPVAGEQFIGWTAHYLTGIAFAALLPVLWGPGWLRDPSLCAALAVGIGSVAAPLLILQPGMGAGIAASRAPRPGAARLQSLVTHAVFGLGLYAAGLATSALLARA